jgi:glycosyltransferase involved in cell wall biosynthesis
MKKVLIIAYYFPPSGGPGVQRALKYVKYLPQYGWEPIVLTAKDADYPARDESLLAEIPSNVKVYRSKIFEPYSLYRKLTGKAANAPVDVENIPTAGKKRSLTERFAEGVRSTLFIPDARIGWLPYAVAEGKRIIRDEHIQALYSSSPPYTTALIARSLQRQCRIPWIAGFRDPWTGFLSTPDRWFLPAAIDAHLERSVYESADRIEVAWRGIQKDFQKKFPHVNTEKCHYLPNGYDSEDYPKIERTTNDRFTVTYTGSMYGKRNPQTFLTAVEGLIAQSQLDPDTIRLRFIGRFGAEVKAMIQQSPLSSSIELIPYLPHSESIKSLMQSDALLLVVDETDDSAEIVPGKVFEYLGAQRPIIALAPKGAISDLMEETGAGIVAHNQDIVGIQQAFMTFYRSFLGEASMYQPNRSAVARYDRRVITGELASILNDLTASR